MQELKETTSQVLFKKKLLQSMLQQNREETKKSRRYQAQEAGTPAQEDKEGKFKDNNYSLRSRAGRKMRVKWGWSGAEEGRNQQITEVIDWTDLQKYLKKIWAQRRLSK